jgi:HK97 gp10 family phage protein
VAKVTMSLTGMDALQRALKTAPDTVQLYAADAVTKTGFAIAQRARALVPVGATGALKRAIASAPASTTRSGPSGRVGLDSPEVFYWRYVEFGTVRVRARPFFRPAADAEADDYVARIRAIGPALERDLSASRFV